MAIQYNVYWSLVSGAGIGGFRMENVSNPYEHLSLLPGVGYYYVVTAYDPDSFQESEPSEEFYASPLGDYKCEGIPASRIDLDAFQRWADWCDDISEAQAENVVPLQCHIYFDQSFSTRKVLDMVSINGRGTVVQMGSKFTTLVDRPEILPAQRFLFTMGNITKDSFAEEFLPMGDRANAVEVTFFDREMNYERQLVEIYADDYDTSDREINKSSVTLYGCSDRFQATDHGRFLMNCNRYLTQLVSFNADVDAIACMPGDIIDVAHDVPEWGESGRVTNYVVNDEIVVLDRGVVLLDDVRYAIGIQHADDDTRELLEVDAYNMEHNIPTTDVLTLTPWTRPPAPGDLYFFGEITRLTKAVRVLSISRSADQRRKISGLEYVPEVYARTGTVVAPELPVEQSQACIGLSGIESWRGGTSSTVLLSWRGFATTWYVFSRVGEEGAWTLLGSTAGLSYTAPNFTLGTVYSFSVSPTTNPDDANAAQTNVDVSGANVKVGVVSEIATADATARVQNCLREICEYFEVESSPAKIYKRKIAENIGVENALNIGSVLGRCIFESVGVPSTPNKSLTRARELSNALGVLDTHEQ